jgi:hypothetical protein
MKDKAMNERKIQQNNLAVITPAAFYTNEKDKIKLNWFLFEYAAELDSHIKRPLRKRGRIENVSLSYQAIEDFFPRLNDKLVDDLLTSAFNAWDSITSMCVKCPTRCISEKDYKAPMFDDPMYYE